MTRTVYFEPVVVRSQSNEERITRLFAMFVGVGYVGYFGILFRGIVSHPEHVAAWWTPLAVVSVFGTGLAVGISSRLRGTHAIKVAGRVAVIGFLIALATWPLAWDGTKVAPPDGVWLAAFPGLPAFAGLLGLPLTAVGAYLVVACVGVQVINCLLRTEQNLWMLVPESLFSLMYCTIFVGGSVLALRAGRLLDEATDDAHSSASEAAAREARATERARFAALTHDSVLSTLLTAARGGPPELVTTSARATRAALDDAASGDSERPLGPVHTVVALRAAATEADAGAEFEVVAHRDAGDPIPADVVRSVSGAVAEALRNSLRHAGPGARRGVRGEVSTELIELVVSDDGDGFVAEDVAPHRLGVAVSILGRMSQLAGGAASIESAPDEGTVVRLRWARA